MRRYYLTLVLLVPVLAFAAGAPYPVSAIPEKLTKNANVVYRLRAEEYQWVSLTEAYYRQHIVVTILNEKGSRHASMVAYYDKNTKVNKFEGSLYNANGDVIRKLKSKEILDRSAVDDNNIIDDSRVKFYNFNHHSYPYTVEYEVEQKFQGTYSIPKWIPQRSEFVSVEASSYKFIAPPSYNIRFRAFNYPGAPVEANEGKNRSLRWEVKNQEAIVRPFAAPSITELSTSVLFAPSDFSLSGYTGNGNSWDGYGKFILTLNNGRDKLPDNIIQKVKDLTAGISDEKEKVRVLYEFLQANTRYISIQLGIGGLQPFEASYVASKGYGDCKALSNYMYSLLKAAGIRSNYTLIYGGRDYNKTYMVEDFPSDQFNHIVLSVPMGRDTMWLECTSQKAAPGYMGGFTGNRKALVITEDGARLVNTPTYGSRENTHLRKIFGKLDKDGNLEMRAETVYRGLEQDEKFAVATSLSSEETMKYLQKEFELGTYSVNSFNYDIKKSVIPEVTERLTMSVPSYATVSGKRLFIVPNVLEKGGMRLTHDASRTMDYVLDYEYINEDQVEIEIPEGYQLEAPMQDISIKSKFGSYSASMKVEGNKIIYNRKREHFGGRFPAKDGEEIVKFYGEVYKADRNRIVFVKAQ